MGPEEKSFHYLNLDALDPQRKHLPLLLLDIDGVINATKKRMQVMELPDDVYQDYCEYLVDANDVRTYRFWTSSTVIRVLRELHESGMVEIAWLTTWEHQANEHVGPTLGLPTFPVLATMNKISDHAWKTNAAIEASQLHRPVIWLDDTEITPRSEEAYAESGVPHLLIRPDYDIGLTKSDIARIMDFIKEHSPSEPALIDQRGVPTHECLCCGSRVFVIRATFEDYDISAWLLEGKCDGCGCPVTVPCPADSPEHFEE